MGTKVMTANSTIVYDKQRGENRQFFAGDEFDTVEDRHLLEQMGDHLFIEKPTEAEPDVDLMNTKRDQLLAICEELGLEPKSNKKQDLIDAIKVFQDEGDATA